MRRRQRGLMLLTAHRAKGLEFDHVVVLDGGWDRFGLGEDADATRRLYYVAMTRARATLALARFREPHPLQDALRGSPSLLLRQAPIELPAAAPELARRYRRLSLRDVFLQLRRGTSNMVIQCIAPLPLSRPATGWGCETAQIVGSFLIAKGRSLGNSLVVSRHPDGVRCTFATVLAVVTWDRERSEPQYLSGLQCDAWEVVVPELVFEPGS